MPPPSLHHIQRIDNESKRTHAWRVRAQYKSRGVIRHFSDKPYGGKRKALQAALAYRDELLQQIHDERYNLWRRQRKRRNNTSGTVGVGRYIARDMVAGREVERPSWLAFWDGADGKRHSRKFSVSKYGEAKAKALAHAARRKALAAMLG